MFSETSLNANFWKIHKFFGFPKKVLQNLYPLQFYVALDIALLMKPKVHIKKKTFSNFF